MIIIKHPKFVATALWLLVIASSLSYIITNLSVVANMQQFMPSDSQDKRLKVLLHETQKGVANNLILVQLSGGSAVYLAKLSKRLKRSLAKNKTSFSSVVNGEQHWNLESYQSLLDNRYLLNNETDFSVTSLRTAFKELLTIFRSGLSGDSIKYLLNDPNRTFTNYLLKQAGQSQPEKINGVWFLADKSKALLMVQLNSTGFDLDFQQNAIKEIENTVNKLDENGNVELLLSGPGTIAVALRDSIEYTTKMVTWVLIAVVLMLFWFGYRSFRLAFMAGIPLLSSIIVAIAVTQIIFGELHGIVLAFGITMLGVCLDYPLHFFSHLNNTESSTDSLKRIWPTLRLGVISSVLAYVALMGTGFSGLTQLAVFSAVGLIVALLVTRWLLPAWVSVSWIRKKKLPVSLPFSINVKISASIGLVLIPLVLLLSQNNIWSNDISQISPIPDALRLNDRQLREDLHAINISHLFLIDGTTMEQVLTKTVQLKQQLKPALDQRLITGILTASDLLPSKAQQILNQTQLPTKSQLQQNVDQALKGLLFKKNAFDAFINDVERNKSGPTITFETLLKSPLGEKLQSMLFQQENHWYSIIRFTGISDDKAFTDWVNSNPELKSNYLSMRASTTVLMNGYLESAWLRLLGVLGLVSLIIFWLASKRKAAIWLFVPILAGVLISLSVQVLLGHLINIFHVLSLLLVIGMGLDYSLFFNRDWSHKSQLQDRTHAIIISAITTIVAFATLGFSNIPILAAMGQTVAVGIITCFLVAQRIAIPFAIPKDSLHG